MPASHLHWCSKFLSLSVCLFLFLFLLLFFLLALSALSLFSRFACVSIFYADSLSKWKANKGTKSAKSRHQKWKRWPNEKKNLRGGREEKASEASEMKLGQNSVRREAGRNVLPKVTTPTEVWVLIEGPEWKGISEKEFWQGPRAHTRPQVFWNGASERQAN